MVVYTDPDGLVCRGWLAAVMCDEGEGTPLGKSQQDLETSQEARREDHPQDSKNRWGRDLHWLVRRKFEKQD